MINIRIIKLPPEANKLARKIEDTIAKMIGNAVKSKISVDNQLKNLEITVYELLFKDIKALIKEGQMKITKKYLQNLIAEEVRKAINERGPIGVRPSMRRRGFNITDDGARRETAASMTSYLSGLRPESQEALQQMGIRLGLANNPSLRRMFRGKSIDVGGADFHPVQKEWMNWVKTSKTASGKPVADLLAPVKQTLEAEGAQADNTIFAYVANYYATRGIRGGGGDREPPADIDESKEGKFANISEQLKWRRGVHPVANKK